VLGVEQIGVHDDFFTLGGHSLLAIQVVSRVNRDFDVGLRLHVLFEAPTIEGLAQRVLDVVRRTLADPRGRWLFDPAHAEARSEWAVAGVDGGEIVHVVVDRTFIDGNVRWIVDFKTGTHEGGDIAGFLDGEASRYRDQLARYARIVGALDGRPVRIALYHPLVPGGFREL